MRRDRIIQAFFYIALFLRVNFSYAQNDVQFSHLTVEDGLTTNNVRCFIQDYQDFIWIGTENGLHRYDGYDFVIYNHDEDNPGSVPGNFIMALFEDSKRRLWIGTLEGGACIYNRENDLFINFTPGTNDSTTIFGQTVGTFYEDDSQRLWLTTEQGSISFVDQNTFNPFNPVFTNISLPSKYIETGHLWITNMVQIAGGQYWLGIHGRGLIRFDLETNGFEAVFNNDQQFPFYFDKRLRGLYKDPQDRLWMLSWGGGLYLYYPKENKLLNYSHDPDNSHSLANNQITSILKDSDENLWIATDDGLSLLNDFKDKYPVGDFTVYKNDPFNERSLTTNAVKPIYQDHQGRIWVGTYFGGVSVYDPDYFRFKTYKSHPIKKNSLPGDNITAIEEDVSGNLWIGTDKSGLCKLPGGSENLHLDIFENIELINSLSGISEKKIKSIDFDGDGKLWIGTWGGGLFSYNPETSISKHYIYDEPNTLPSESILAIAVDNEDNIWIGTFSGGLTYLNATTNQYSYYRYDINDQHSIGNDKINTLLSDREDRLWVGTEGGGLNLFNRETNDFTRIDIDGLSSSFTVITIYQCHDGYIWVGTHSNGLFRLNPENNEVKQYTAEFGLPGNLIQSICEDQDHFLWVSTNNGISKFVSSQNSVTNYSVEEGLQSRQFNPNSAYLCRNGQMIFGGVNGLNAFYPKDIEKNEYIPELVFTGFWLNNQKFNVNDENSPLDKNIIYTERINLNHYQSSFSIEFASLEYDFSNRSQYMTLLEGWDKDWQNRRTERKVTYTNLNPGKYTLNVKSINKDGFVSDQPKTLKIIIHPAWYETRFALIVFFLFLVGLTYAIFQIRVNFFKNQSLKLERIVNSRTNELSEKSSEILAQNEELQAQNDQITEQREELESARDQLKNLNSNLEKLVEERTQKLEKTITELDRFVYSASHDLSAPLKSVLGLLNIAKIDNDIKRTPQYLEYIEESILKLEDVIKSLISYSRNSRLEVKNEKINIRELVEIVINELAFMATPQKIKFHIDIPEKEEVFTDMQRLKIILHNLVNNSIKYSDPEKQASVIAISFERSSNKVAISIEDNGIGIEPNQLRKIFSMFYRATEKSTGSGLGLFIVKETLSMIGGKIKVESTAGEGSKFKISLPD